MLQTIPSNFSLKLIMMAVFVSSAHHQVFNSQMQVIAAFLKQIHQSRPESRFRLRLMPTDVAIGRSDVMSQAG